VDGQRVVGDESAQRGLEVVEAHSNQNMHKGPTAKRARVISATEREIVGLGYSSCMHIADERGNRKGRPGQSSMASHSEMSDQKKTNPGGRYARDMKRVAEPQLDPSQREYRNVTGTGGQRRPAPRWCPDGLNKTQWCQL
jgi:hypothetical protein